jgi:hypothetical protein
MQIISIINIERGKKLWKGISKMISYTDSSFLTLLIRAGFHYYEIQKCVSKK